MSAMDSLFISAPKLVFEDVEKLSAQALVKRASTDVDEDPSTWSQAVINELFRVCPEASEYVPQVTFVAQDEEQGFALGFIALTSATDSAMSATRSESSARKLRVVIIPAVIRHHEMAPLDIMLTPTKRFVPLTGPRLREALFRPESFDMITNDWGDDGSLANLFQPPGRHDNSPSSGMAGQDVTTILGTGMKTSSVEPHLLGKVATYFVGGEVQKLASLLADDEALTAQIAVNPSFRAALDYLAKADTALPEPGALLKTASSRAPRHVVQMGYDDARDQYWVKTASRVFYVDEPRAYMDRKAMLKFAGEEVLRKIDIDGTVTVAPRTMDVSSDADASRWLTVEDPGIYKVMTVAGKEMTGWVLPRLLDLDGNLIPMAVFTNGAAAIVQGQIAGSPVASGVNLPAMPPAGNGVFYMSTPDGVTATVPLQIMGRDNEKSGVTSYLVQTMLGESKRIRLVPGLKAPQPMGDALALPAETKFLALEDEQQVALIERPSEMHKTAAYTNVPKIRLYSDGVMFGMEFENMPKLASVTPAFEMTRDEAIFTLCAAGMDARLAHSVAKLAAAETQLIEGLRDVRLASDIVNPAVVRAGEATKVAAALRRDLIKEAAVLPDVQTVDTVLGLNFINAENIRMFASQVPYMEKALSMVCELILAARLGLSEVPENAAARAARGIDDVIQGLKALGLRKATDDPAMA